MLLTPFLLPPRFFTKKIGYMPQQDPDLPSIRPSFEAAAAEAAAAGASGLDVELAASGFQKQHADTLDRFLHASSEEVEGSGGEEGEQPEGSSGYGSGSDEDEEGPQEGPAASSGSEEEGQEERVGRGAGVSSSSSSRQQAAGAGLGPGSTAAAAAAAEAAAVGQRLAGVHLTQQQQQQQQQEGQEVCTSHSLPDGAADVQDGCSSSGVEGSGSEGEGEDVWEGVPSSSRGAVTVDMSHKVRHELGYHRLGQVDQHCTWLVSCFALLLLSAPAHQTVLYVLKQLLKVNCLLNDFCICG
jgi:hypothetical protein